VQFERLLEMVMIDAEHDVAIHLDEAAIAVIGEAGVAGAPGQAFDRDVVEAEIEHGIHHARHRHAGARARGDQQRIGGIAELRADGRFDVLQPLLDLRLQLGRVALSAGVEMRADLCGDGEVAPGPAPEIAHLRQPRALPPSRLRVWRALPPCRRRSCRPPVQVAVAARGPVEPMSGVEVPCVSPGRQKSTSGRRPFNPTAPTLDLREVGDAIERRANLGQQAQPIGAQVGLVAVDRHLVEERIDGRAQLRQGAHGAGEILALERLAAGFATGGERTMQRLLLVLPQQRAIDTAIVGLAVLLLLDAHDVAGPAIGHK
jgi:hypothetical protein